MTAKPRGNCPYIPAVIPIFENFLAKSVVPALPIKS